MVSYLNFLFFFLFLLILIILNLGETNEKCQPIASSLMECIAQNYCSKELDSLLKCHQKGGTCEREQDIVEKCVVDYVQRFDD